MQQSANEVCPSYIEGAVDVSMDMANDDTASYARLWTGGREACAVDARNHDMNRVESLPVAIMSSYTVVLYSHLLLVLRQLLISRPSLLCLQSSNQQCPTTGPANINVALLPKPRRRLLLPPWSDVTPLSISRIGPVVGRLVVVETLGHVALKLPPLIFRQASPPSTATAIATLQQFQRSATCYLVLT